MVMIQHTVNGSQKTFPERSRRFRWVRNNSRKKACVFIFESESPTATGLGFVWYTEERPQDRPPATCNAREQSMLISSCKFAF